MKDRPRLDLTDSEWMDIVDGDRAGLPRCCANISTLRDGLISAARNGGRVDFFNQVEQHFAWCFPEHDVPPLMLKVAEQLGLTIEYNDHDPQIVEI